MGFGEEPLKVQDEPLFPIKTSKGLCDFGNFHRDARGKPEELRWCHGRGMAWGLGPRNEKYRGKRALRET